MERKMLKLALFLMPLFFLSPLIAFAQPTEKTLIESWENIQRNDSETIIFEKIEEGQYKFKTERFSFNGEIKILNVTIDKSMGGFDYGNNMGVIELELVNLPDDFFNKYSYGYSIWAQNNILYYDQEIESWLSSKEYNIEIQKNIKKQRFLMGFGNLFTIAIFIIFVILMLVGARNIEKKNRKLIKDSQDSVNKSLEIGQKSLVLNTESNKILKEILEVLKNHK